MEKSETYRQVVIYFYRNLGSDSLLRLQITHEWFEHTKTGKCLMVQDGINNLDFHPLRTTGEWMVMHADFFRLDNA